MSLPFLNTAPGYDEELARKFHDNAVRSLPEERAAELAARTLTLPDAQSVELIERPDESEGGDQQAA